MSRPSLLVAPPAVVAAAVPSDATEAAYMKLLERCGEEAVATAMAAMGLLEEELYAKKIEEFAEEYPGTPPEVLGKKAVVHGQKRAALLKELSQRLTFIKPLEAKLYLTLPYGEKQQWDEFRSTLGSVQVENKDSEFYALSVERNARAMQKFEEGSRRKFKGFVEEMLTEKQRAEAGAAKTAASTERLRLFKKEQGQYYKNRKAVMAERQKKIDKCVEKEDERRAEYEAEIDAKAEKKTERSNACKQQVLDDMQGRADARNAKLEEVHTKLDKGTRDFLRNAKRLTVAAMDGEKAMVAKMAADKKQKSEDDKRRGEALLGFRQRKRDYESKVQGNTEAKYLVNEAKYENSRKFGEQQRMNRSKSMGTMLNTAHARWTKAKGQEDAKYATFAQSVNDMHARQQDNADNAKHRTFVSDVIEKRARRDIYGDMQRDNRQRQLRQNESFSNANLVHVTLRNQSMANLKQQQDNIQKERQRMFMELGVKADQAKDVFYRLKGESDPKKVGAMLQTIGMEMPQVPGIVIEGDGAGAEKEAAKPLF